MQLALALILAASLAAGGVAREGARGRCSGGANCTACTTCEYCKNCAQNGGSCSVCESIAQPAKAAPAKKPVKSPPKKKRRTPSRPKARP